MVGALLTLAVGVYLVLIAGIVSGLVAAWAPDQGMPSIVPGVIIVAAAAAALAFASVMIVGRAPRSCAVALTAAGVVACIAQAEFATAFNGGEQALFTLIQPGLLVLAGGVVALGKTSDRQLPRAV